MKRRAGRPRIVAPVDRLPLVGGLPCLDFVNATGNRGGAPRERLASYRDLLVFCRRTGVLADDAARRLLRRAAARPRQAARALADLIELRETLYRILGCARAGRAPAADDLRRFNDEHGRAIRRRRLAWSRAGPAWSWEDAPSDLTAMRVALVNSAAELLTSPELRRVRQCDACDWLFLDSSKNGSRLYCKKACSDRVRSRRYYRRRQKAKR